MSTPTGGDARPSRVMEFLRGFFLPLLFFTLSGVAAFAFFQPYDTARLKENAGAEAYPIGTLFTLLGSVALVIRWWPRARSRSWGVIAGFFAIPPILLLVAVLYVLLFDVNLYPR